MTPGESARHGRRDNECVLFPGASEMHARVRTHDWSRTSLGPIGDWPQSLKTAVSVCLDSGFPHYVWWGPDLIQIYNDAATRILRAKHPMGLGQLARECWSAVWPDLGAFVEHVLATGEPERHEGLAVTPDRGGPREAASFDFCYSALRSESGEVAGVFITTIETTDRLRAEAALRDREAESRQREERQAFLLALGDRMREQDNPEEVIAVATRMLGEELKAARIVFAEIDEPAGVARIREGWTATGAEPHPSTLPLRDFGGPLLDQLRAGQTARYDDVGSPPYARPDLAALAAIGIKAGLSVPLIVGGRFVVNINVHQHHPRTWSDAEVALVEEVAARIWAAVERARAQSALRASEAWLTGQKEALQAAISDAPLETSLGVLVRTACEHDSELRCAFYLVNASGSGLYHIVGMNEDYARLVDGLKIGADSLSCGLAAYLAQPVVTADVTEEPLWKPWLQMAEAHDFRACWSFPVETAAGKVLGTFAMYYRQPREAQARDYEFADIVTRAASIIIARHQAAEERTRVENALRDSETQLQKASRAKDEFLAMLGHELRNPLQPIATTLELMRLRQPDVLAGERAIIKSQVQHMTGMVDDLLDVSRIARGKLELKRMPLDVGDIVIRAIDTAQPLLEEQEQTVEKAIADGLVVEGDRRRLVQVVTNLLTNAAKYSPPEQTIRVSAGAENGQVVIRVRDQGYGIDPALLPHIFETFIQDAQSIERSQGGLGLGLAIVHNLTRMHGGTVEAQSEGCGHGSEFIVRLPRLVDATGSTNSNAGEKTPAKVESASGANVLIVDDYADAADSLAELLKMDGHNVRVVYDGAAALKAAAEFQPAIALVDIGLPVMDGYEVARRLREMPGTEKLILVALTGYGQESDRQRTHQAGFDEHLVKPLDPMKIGELIERFTKNLDDSAG